LVVSKARDDDTPVDRTTKRSEPTSKLLEAEALEAVNRPRPVMLFDPPVTVPPKVKALIWRVPVEERMLVPPPVKDNGAEAPVKDMSLALNPLVTSKDPVNELDPVLDPVIVPLIARSPDMEALLLNSNGEEMVTPPVKVQSPPIL
jgi:hypothetical protein